MRTTEDFKKLVFERAEQKAAEQRRRRKAIRNFSMLFALCLVISLSAYLGVRVFSPANSAGRPMETAGGTRPLETTGGVPEKTETEDGTALNSQDSHGTTPSATSVAYTTVPMTTPASTSVAPQATSVPPSETTAPAWVNPYTLVISGAVPMGDDNLLGVFFEVNVKGLSECMTAYTSKESFLCGFGNDREIKRVSVPIEKMTVYAIWYKSTCPPCSIFRAEQDGHLYFRITEFEDRRGEEKMYLCFVYVEKDEAPYEGLFLGEEKKNIRILPNDSVVYTGTNSLSASFAEKDSPYMAEHMEFYSTKAAWQARFAGELLCDMYDSKFFLKNDVYVLWVRRTGKPGKVYLDKKDGEYVFDIRFEKFPDGEEKVYRILVTVPKEYPRIGGMLSEMKYIVR